MTGVDFSGPAVAAAMELAAATGAGASFVQADVYDADKVLEPGSFALAYTGFGARGGLPRIRRWARVVTALLDTGMTLTGLAEHDSVPWNALPGMMTQTDGEWRLTENPGRLPRAFSTQAEEGQERGALW